MRPFERRRTAVVRQYTVDLRPAFGDTESSKKRTTFPPSRRHEPQFVIFAYCFRGRLVSVGGCLLRNAMTTVLPTAEVRATCSPATTDSMLPALAAPVTPAQGTSSRHQMCSGPTGPLERSGY